MFSFKARLLLFVSVASLAFSLGCSPRDEAVLNRTKSARASSQGGGTVVQATAGAVIDRSEQRSSECRKMDWKTIDIPVRFNPALISRSMRAYITLGNYACFRIGAEDTEIMKYNEVASVASRGRVQVSRIEILGRDALTENHAALMGLSLADLQAFLQQDVNNARNKTLVNVVYFEIKSLNITDDPGQNVAHSVVTEVGQTFADCAGRSETGALQINDTDYDFVNTAADPALLLNKKTCLRVGANVTVKAGARAELARSVEYLERGLVAQLRREALEQILGESIPNRRAELEARQLIIQDLEARFGAGAARREVFVIGLDEAVANPEDAGQ